jgi:hypothetical protein
MQPIQPPQTIKIYQLVRQSGMNFSSMATATTGINLGLGFFITLQEAEHYRTLEVLKLTSGSQDRFHIFELEVPNPAYKGNE